MKRKIEKKQRFFNFPAPAKLNLFLHIIASRGDGYHEIQTLFQLLDYGDTLTFVQRSDSEIRVHLQRASELPMMDIPVADNLIIRAANMLRDAFRRRNPDKLFTGVDIFLHKRIPVGSGLGGGSSDAATTLHALNLLWDCRLDQGALAELGAALGADVPVFVRGTSAWAEGRGDQLTAMSLPSRWYVILVPAVLIITDEIFQSPDLVRNCPPIRMQDYASSKHINAFQAVVERRYPMVSDALAWLNHYGSARLSGSGSSVFVGFDTYTTASQVIADKPSEFFGFTARGVDYSPLLDRLAALSK